MGFRVEGVTEAKLTSAVFVACPFQHSWRRLAGLRPSAFSEGARNLGKPQEFQVGWAGWTRPPTMGGRGEGEYFLEGSKHPEAGWPRQIGYEFSN